MVRDDKHGIVFVVFFSRKDRLGGCSVFLGVRLKFM